MDETNQAKFSGWARVEVMGHQSHIGFVTTEAYGQAVMFRVDSPQIPETEETLSETDWVGDTRVPAGTVVKRGGINASSVLVGSGSIYRIIPCTEAVALHAISSGARRPLSLVRLPELPLLVEQSVHIDRGRMDDDYESDPPF